MKVHHLAWILMTTLAAPAWAAVEVATLSVPSMDCAVCPITVKKALTQVPGVSDAKVDFAKREAVVRFDPDKTTIEGLTKATKQAGYPSSVVKAVK